jgi:hypothetical protein
MKPTRDYARFNPQTYLNEYYTSFPSENLAQFRFLINAFSKVSLNARVLEFGSGPTLFSSIISSPRAREIHVSEYSDSNRDEISRWLRRDPKAFDWRPTIRKVLELEGQSVTDQKMLLREAEVRRKLTQVMPCDATSPFPLEVPVQYPVVVSNLCIEAAAQNHEQWQQCMLNMCSLIEPGGKLILAAAKEADAYPVGGDIFPVVKIDETDMQQVLQMAGFVPETIHIEWENADHPIHSYGGLLFVTATRSRSVPSLRDSGYAAKPN